jgi:glycosyltransferase involved in cell wall biosynthesis
MERILVTSTQYPYYGGAATNSYALIKYLRSQGFKVAGVFFDKHSTPVDPDKIGGVWRVSDKNTRNLVKRIIVKHLEGRPDLILAKNYAAPLHSRSMFGLSKLAYMVTGSPHMIQLSSEGISANKYLRSDRKDRFTPEIKAIKNSDIVIPNSPIGRKLLVKHYGNMRKIALPIDTSMALNRTGRSRDFNSRQYDIAFIASNLKRNVKNAKLAKRIFKKFGNSKKIVIGNNNHIFKGMSNTKVYSIMKHHEVINILSNTKLVLCTSYYDASPNTIKEAVSCGCNVLISRNCGWSETYPEEFICKDVYDLQEWIDKTAFLLQNNIPYTLNISSSNEDLANKIRGL